MAGKSARASKAVGESSPPSQSDGEVAAGTFSSANNTVEHISESLAPEAVAEVEFDESRDGASFPIVGVGASAGGLEAFTQFLRALPADTGMAFVLVQHLAPSHPSALAEILSRATKMSVLEVQDEPTVEPNHVYVIPPGRSMIIAGGKLQLLPREARKVPHPVDQFFRSLAKEQRHQAIGVVLSGTATDGTIGLEEIKAEGGITFAQDASAQHEGMPHSAIASGCVDFVLPPDGIAREIARIGRHAYAVPEAEAREADERPNLAQVVRLLKNSTGVDFTGYKFNTLYRRVTRRMVFQKIDGLADYVRFLRETPSELEALYSDILISVTSFFRDKESFDALKSQVFPRLLKDRSRHDPVRLWTLGCSTGQEAYSLAMTFAEAAEAAGSNVPLQLFASDLNAAGIEKARAGVYPKDIEQDVSPERLRRFFTEVDGQYRITKSIRDACVFSRHNVLADPPFSRIDMISCRNLLIYLEPVLQQKIMPQLHYALKPAGCLWLGGSETIGGYRNLFEAEDAKHKIYTRKPGSGPGHGHFPLQHAGTPRAPFVPVTTRPSDAADLPREADRVLLSRFAPPGVLVSADLEILQYRGETGRFLAPAPGKASFSLLKMLREGLLVAVRAAVQRAGKEGGTVREEGLRVKSNGGYHEVAVEVIPLKGHGEAKDGGFLIVFEESGPLAPRDVRPAPRAEREDNATDPDNTRLAQELAATREYLQSVIEQQEAANEELQSANEEVQSANEELQSTNEELETSKEEIQSSNEELATVNDELNNRNAELNRVNNDLVNVLGSVQFPIVMLGPDFRIRRFTPAAEKLLNLVPADVGRPLTDIKLTLDNLVDLEPLLAEVLDTVSVRERNVQDKHGRFYSLRLRPYRTLDNKIDGVVLMLVDIDAMKRAGEVVLQSEVRFSALFDASPVGMYLVDSELRIRLVNPVARPVFGNIGELIGRDFVEVIHILWTKSYADEIVQLFRRTLATGEPYVTPRRIEKRLDRGVVEAYEWQLHRIDLPDGKYGVVCYFIDISERVLTERALQDSEHRFRDLADNIPQLAWIADAATDGQVNWFNRNWLEYTGTTLEEMKGQGWHSVHHPDHAERVIAKFARHVREGLDWEDTFPLRGKSGEYRWFLSRMKVIRDEDGAVARIFGTNTDVTDERKMADDLRHYSAELAEADRRKNEFLAMLAHELRNPLAPIRNAAQILRSSESDGTAVRQASEMMERQVGQMVRLVEDLLDVSRVSRGKIALRRGQVELASIIHHAVETSRPNVDCADHALTIDLPPKAIYVNADPTRLTQVVGNLLNNACKFTAKGGRISIVVERDGTEAVIRVRDSGVGIAADELPHIFDLFVQIDTTLERSVGGLGIGLTLVKNLVELHGGTVSVHSAGVGQGSEFEVRLPALAAGTESPPTPNSGAARPAPARRILVVDDNRDSADSLAMLLNLTGHATHTAYDGLGAVKAAETLRPEFVLLDIGLPGLNGYEASRRIRAEAWGKGMVLIALTGWGQDEDRQKSRDAGFDHHLVKPVDHAILAKLLAELPGEPGS